MFDAQCVSEIAIVAKELGIQPEALQAVAEVESAGRIFAEVAGRREPLIRFEGHYFDRLLGARQRQMARQNGLAHPSAGKIRNSRSQQKRWNLLHRAIAINRIAALSSVSWGLGQVMGAHWQWLGYASVDALVAEARSGAAGQVRLMARYIDKAGLIPTINSEDWTTFARTYNGPGFAQYAYDKKIAAAYQNLKNQSAQPETSMLQDGENTFVGKEEDSNSGWIRAIALSAGTKFRKAIRTGLLLISKRIL